MKELKFIAFLQVLTLVINAACWVFIPITLEAIAITHFLILAISIAAPYIAVAFDWWMGP